MRKMKDFWHDGSVKEMFQTLTKTITPEEKEELQDLIDDLDWYNVCDKADDHLYNERDYIKCIDRKLYIYLF